MVVEPFNFFVFWVQQSSNNPHQLAIYNNHIYGYTVAPLINGHPQVEDWRRPATFFIGPPMDSLVGLQLA